MRCGSFVAAVLRAWNDVAWRRHGERGTLILLAKCKAGNEAYDVSVVLSDDGRPLGLACSCDDSRMVLRVAVARFVRAANA